MTVSIPAPTNTPPASTGILNGGFLWREDAALKKYLNDAALKVWDQTAPAGGRSVRAYFRNPDNDVRTRQFPYILIDRLGWERDPEREHRGMYYLPADDPYTPDTATQNVDYVSTQLPIPVMIRYQVQAWARFRQQLMWIENQMATVLPIRFGAINMTSVSRPYPVADDHTMRRLELLSGPVPSDASDPDGNANKKIFGLSWTIGITSEYFTAPLNGGVAVVDEVIVDPSGRTGYDSLVDAPTVIDP